jgi:pSer/pThr/pTyr-binding forkhead associated (FHA) protein
MWILKGSGPETDLFTFRVSGGAVKTIGRAPRADFIVNAALVSRLHCRLEAGPNEIDVVDLSSTNGTYVNDKKIDRARLASGDRLRIGRVELTVEHQTD